MSISVDSRRGFLHTAAFGVAGVGAAGISTARGAAAFGASHAADQAQPPSAELGYFNVRQFGAAGDGKAVDTPAVNRAIAAAAAAGGGTVLFPAGSYLCYSIRLKSHVALYLGRGATIIAADSPGSAVTSPGGHAYDLAEPNPAADSYQDFGHTHFQNSLIWGDGLEDIAILGPGRIWGRGLSKGYGPGPIAEVQGVGNKSISLKNCRNVLLRDFEILHGGHFGLLATGVDNFTIDNLRIDTNRDGMDIDCCRNVRLSNCTVNSPWDDGIVLKSSYGLGEARATESVTITNCLVTGSYQEGTVLDGTWKRFDPSFRVGRTGRIKFGTESNAGFRKIAISNCVFEACQGLALETVDGAILEDIAISNITMNEITSAPIFVRLGARMRGPQGIPVGVLRRVLISNIVCGNSASGLGSILSGIPGHMIEDVKLSDIYIQHRGGGTAADAAYAPPEVETMYPEPDMFSRTRGQRGFHHMPAQGFYVRHARDIEMSHIEIEAMSPDARPSFVFDDVESATLLRVQAPHAAGQPAFALNNVRDFNLYLSRPWADTHLDSASGKTL